MLFFPARNYILFYHKGRIYLTEYESEKEVNYLIPFINTLSNKEFKNKLKTEYHIKDRNRLIGGYPSYLLIKK